jgi:hypothetical protein
MIGARLAGETVNLGSGAGGAVLFAATFGVASLRLPLALVSTRRSAMWANACPDRR